jgi:hypothetical protein
MESIAGELFNGNNPKAESTPFGYGQRGIRCYFASNKAFRVNAYFILKDGDPMKCLLFSVKLKGLTS